MDLSVDAINGGEDGSLAFFQIEIEKGLASSGSRSIFALSTSDVRAEESI